MFHLHISDCDNLPSISIFASFWLPTTYPTYPTYPPSPGRHLHPDERQIRGVADQRGEATGAQGATGVLQEGHLFPRSLHLGR